MSNEAVLDELQTIYTDHGVCTAQLVVEAASDPASSLHAHMTWDDTAAASAHRLNQARQLIRSVWIWIERPNGPVQTRAMVNIDPGPTGERTYMPVLDAMSDPVTRAILLRRAWQEMQSFRRKYANLEELSQVIDAMAEAAA